MNLNEGAGGLGPRCQVTPQICLETEKERNAMNRGFLTGWKVTHLPATVVRVCPRRIKIRVFLDAQEKTVNVDPDNLIHPREMENDKKTMKHGYKDIQLLTF